VNASIRRIRLAHAHAFSFGTAIALVVASLLLGPASPATAQEIIWTRQFGSAVLEVAAGVALDGDENVYVGGSTNGALPGQTAAGSSDVFVRKYDTSGHELWTRQFGTGGQDEGHAVAVDASGNVYVVGLTFGSLPDQALSGAVDAFVRKYGTSGNELWTRQFGTAGLTFAFGVGADGSGNVYVGGQTSGELPGQSSAGGSDSFVRKYDASGNALWTRQFGTSLDDEVRGVAVDASGNAYVAGSVGGALPGQIPAAGDDAFLRKYDPSGSELWTHQFGSEADDDALSVAVDASGNAHVAGRARGPLPGQSWLGDRDVFVRKYDASGTELWTRQFGTSARDEANGVAADVAGNAYVAGESRGALPGQTSAGNGDIFVRKYDSTGNELWTRQFGTAGVDHARGVAASVSANAYVAGRAGGALPGQTAAGGPGDVDAFVAKVGLADAIPPTTVATIAPAANAAGWNNTDVTIALTASDNVGGSDVASLTYSATGAQVIASTEIEGAAASIIVSAEGITTVFFAARDVAGNAEIAGSITVRLDKTRPIRISFPFNVVKDATSPSGTTVDYEPVRFADALDPLPSVACSPASGTVFPIGFTAVTCTATDQADNYAGASFLVIVRSASVQLTLLAQKAAADVRLSTGQRNSLGAMLRHAQFFAARAESPDPTLPVIREGMRNTACLGLSAIQQVLITWDPAPDVVAEYTADIIRIRSALGCT